MFLLSVSVSLLTLIYSSIAPHFTVILLIYHFHFPTQMLRESPWEQFSSSCVAIGALNFALSRRSVFSAQTNTAYPKQKRSEASSNTHKTVLAVHTRAPGLSKL